MILILYIYKIRYIINPLISILIVLLYGVVFNASQTHHQTIDKKVPIIKVDTYDSYQRYTIIYGLKRYHFNHRRFFDVGDTVHIKGNIEDYRKQTIPGGFNAFNYQKGQGVYGVIRIDYLELNQKSMISNLSIKSSPLMDLFKDRLLLDTTWMMHLFKLSSIHLAFLIMILLKIMYYLDIEDRFKFGIVSFIMAILYVIGYSIIIFRMMIKYFLKFLNDIFHLEIDGFNIECMTLVSILILKPYIIYNQTFLVIYSMVLCMHLKNEHIKALNFIGPPMIIAPFLLLWYKDLSLLSLFLMPIAAGLLKYIFIPILMISSILPLLNIMQRFEGIMVQVEQFIIPYDFSIYLTHLEGFMWVIYFCLLIFVFSSNNQKSFYKRIIMYFIICFISFLNTFKPVDDHVMFLDVGQGDSAVIFKENKVIVVDAFENVSHYLKYNYVYTIDYLVLTHPDQDHIKEANTLIENFEVLHVIVNGYDDYLIKHPNTISIKSAPQKIDEILDIQILGPLKNYHHRNNNSLVFKIDVADKSYLFTGDIGTEPEQDYINTYGQALKSDVLKVPHHGSNTSSSEAFISYVEPRIVVISVGHRNIYQLPHNDVLKMYENLNVKLHLTKDFGSLKIGYQILQNFPP